MLIRTPYPGEGMHGGYRGNRADDFVEALGLALSTSEDDELILLTDLSDDIALNV